MPVYRFRLILFKGKELKIVIAVLLLVTVTGCSRGFAKEGATYQDFYEDLTRCTNATDKKLDTPAIIFGNGAANNYAQLAQKSENRGKRNNCMKYLNWEIRTGSDVFHP